MKPNKIMLICFAVVMLTAAKCHKTDECEPDTTRCENNQVQICNAGQNWDVIADCNDFELNSEPVEMTCTIVDSEPDCVEGGDSETN